MENELPNIWWILDPAFIETFCTTNHIEGDEDNHHSVRGVIEKRLREQKDLPDTQGGITSSISVESIDNLMRYRQMLLRTAALNKHDLNADLPQINIVITIPSRWPSLYFIDQIVKITRGVRTYIKPVITFVDKDEYTTTIEI